jgi:hypothetical protein
VGNTDPETFARHTAALLFTWDTVTTTPAAVTEAVIALGDPTGEETAGLASDLGNYLPDQTLWGRLREYETRQELDITSVEIPDSWNQVKADAPAGSVLPGTRAYTVTGIRHRDGRWEDEPTTFDEPVTFTMFITCQPTFDECHLMRLSQLNNPLK